MEKIPVDAAGNQSQEAGAQPEPQPDASKACTTPAPSAILPDKNVKVPIFLTCMASDPTVDEEVIDAAIEKSSKNQ